ncbi:MAG: polymerase [Treponema sp.]|jgi:hypothetical protein|nr:polymerase [Treponema sp.]
MYRLIFSFLFVFLAAIGSFADINTSISGTVEWDAMQIKAEVILDLASAGLRLPAGRIQGEMLLNEYYLHLIRQSILGLQVDSSSTVADLVNRGEFSLQETETLALEAASVPPALSQDMRSMFSSYTINLSGVSSLLLRNVHTSRVGRTLNPVSTAQYTGIVIIASESLPVHGMRSMALAVPCLFPKIWDNDMNLVYERSMLETRDNPMVRYSSSRNIFLNNPSGLSAELQEIVGDRPLRIFANGVFGINPADLIIDRNDALLIISSEENRRLLSQGKVAIILNESVLKSEFKN